MTQVNCDRIAQNTANKQRGSHSKYSFLFCETIHYSEICFVTEHHLSKFSPLK